MQENIKRYERQLKAIKYMAQKIKKNELKNNDSYGYESFKNAHSWAYKNLNYCGGSCNASFYGFVRRLNGRFSAGFTMDEIRYILSSVKIELFGLEDWQI